MKRLFSIALLIAALASGTIGAVTIEPGHSITHCFDTKGGGVVCTESAFKEDSFTFRLFPSHGITTRGPG